MDTNYYNYIEHTKHNMSKILDKGSIVPIKDDVGVGFRYYDTDKTDQLQMKKFRTVADYDPRLSNQFTKEDSFLDFPELNLPIDLDDFFTDIDHEICEKKFWGKGDEDDSSTQQVVHSKNIGWLIHPARSIGTKVAKDDKRGVCIGHILSPKYKKYFWEYANDTFHEDFIDIIKDHLGYKQVPVSIISIKDLHHWHHEGVQPWHDYTPIPYYTRRTETCINFRLFSSTDDDETEVNFGWPSVEVHKEFSKISDELNENIIDKFQGDEGRKVEWIHNENLQIKTALHQDTILPDSQLNDEIELVATKKGYHCPFMINTNYWHRVYTKDTKTPRITLRFFSPMGVPFHHFRKLHQEGKLLKNL
tara:strand:+ start:367 stop:1449 length:1083 start_codon:yes stop_codon:yes gene_type:complete